MTDKHDKDGETFLISSGADFDNLDVDSLLEEKQDTLEALTSSVGASPVYLGVKIKIPKDKEEDDILCGLFVSAKFETIKDDYQTYTQESIVVLQMDDEDIFDLVDFNDEVFVDKVFMTFGSRVKDLFKEDLVGKALNKSGHYNTVTYGSLKKRTMKIDDISEGKVKILFRNTYLKK